MGEERSSKRKGHSEAAATCGASPPCTPSDVETQLVRNLQQHKHIPLSLLSPTISNIASSDDDTAALALKSLGYTLHHEDIVAVFSDESALAVISSLLEVITTAKKGLCRLGIWCLGVQEFGVPLLETQIHPVVQAIVHAIDNPMDSKAVTYEALQALVKMVHKVPNMRLAASLWAPPVYRKLLSLDKRDREMAERCVKDVESVLLPPIPSLSKVAAADIRQTLLCVMEKMVRSRAFVIPTIRAWSWLVRLLGSKAAGENRLLVNQMLKVAEVTFTSHDSQIQIASLVAWEALIDALIQQDDNLQQQMDTVSPSARSTHKPFTSPSAKRLKLLMTPVLTIMSGASHQSVRLACWRTWSYLAHRLDLGINSAQVQANVVTPMFEEVFKAGPERGSSGVWDLCLNALEAWITCKLHDKLDSRSNGALSIGLEGEVSSPKTPSQTKSTDGEVEAPPIKWASWCMESLESILMLIKILWACGVNDLKHSHDNLSLTGAIRMLFLVVRGVDNEGKRAVKPSMENVTCVHAVLRFVTDLSVDRELLKGVEKPVSTLWPAFEVLLEFGYLVLSSSFYKLPFCPFGSQPINDHFSVHLSPSIMTSPSEASPILENRVTPIAYINGIWIQVGCSVLCNHKEQANVLQKLEKLAECTKTGLGIMNNLQGVELILDRLLLHVLHKQENSGVDEDLLATGVKTHGSTTSTGLELWSKDSYFLQVWKIFACQLASHIESSNDVPVVESGIQDSGYQVVLKFLLLPVQLCLDVMGSSSYSDNVSQGHPSHRHTKCLKLLQSPNELDFVIAAWTRLYDCCSRVSSLKSSQPNSFGSAYCQKLSRLLGTHECSLDQGGIDKHALHENPLLPDILGLVAKHVLRQIDISSLAMLAINRKKRLGSFVSNGGPLGNDIEDTSNVRDFLCLASRILDLSWSKLTTSKTCWLGVASRVLSALAGFVTHLYSQQDCLMLLQEFSRPLAKWLSSSKIKDNACPLSKVLQQALQDLWEKLLTLLQKCQPPLCFNSSLLSLQSPLLVPAFQHHETSISNSTLTFWESTYGFKASFLKYPPSLAPVLQQLSENVKITLPGWEKTMASKDVSQKLTGGRRHLHLHQDESIIRKKSKQADADTGSGSEVDGMYLSMNLRPSKFCQNAKAKSIGKPLDALLEKFKRPACKLNALAVSSKSENTVESVDALACPSNEQSNDIIDKDDAFVLHGVENANQNAYIKQRDVGATCEALKDIHRNQEPLQKLASNVPSSLKLPCQDELERTREHPSLLYNRTLASDCEAPLYIVKGDNVPASEGDSAVPARRKKLKFLDDDDLVEYATIPLTQKKAGPLTDHQKEVRRAQSGTPGSGCTSHGAGIRTYTSMDFSQSQIVLDSEDPEDILLEIPVQVVKDEDDEKFKDLGSSLVSARHSSLSLVLTNGQTNMIHKDDNLLEKLPHWRMPKDGKLYAAESAEHQGQIHGLPNSRSGEEPQFVPRSEQWTTVEKGDEETLFERGEPSAQNIYNRKCKQAMDNGNASPICENERSSLLNCLVEEALDGSLTQAITQPCDTQLCDTQLLEELHDEVFGLARANGAVCALLHAANSSCQWNDMDMESLEQCQRLINSVQRQVHERKMRLAAGHPPFR